MTTYTYYGWTFSEPDHTDASLLVPLAQLLASAAGPKGPLRLVALGCGNGWLSSWLAERAFLVIGN